LRVWITFLGGDNDMNAAMASIYEARFKGNTYKDYRIGNLIDCGKSAAVFKAEDRDGNAFAFKIFDNEMIERFGKDEQTRRIYHEISLQNHGIPNLVKIQGGGEFLDGGETFLYIVMEFLPGQNLKRYLVEHGPQPEKIAKLLFQTLYNVTEKLLEKGIVHRDIKPENILVSSDCSFTLMDLGVIKIIEEATGSGTDFEDHKPFIGTLKYAPPEFLLREEVQEKTDAWRAINLYQIAATVHDVIMGHEIFSQYSEPFAKLVIAVKEEMPHIQRADYSHEFLSLTREMLSKRWGLRLQLFRKYNPDEVFQEKGIKKTSDLAELLELTQGNRVKREEISVEMQKANQRREKEDKINESIRKVIIEKAEEGLQIGLYKDASNDSAYDSRLNQREYYCRLSGDLDRGFDASIYIRALINQNEERVTIHLSALNPGDTEERNGDFSEIFASQKYNKGMEIVNGIYDEPSFKDYFNTCFQQIIIRAIENMRPFVDGRLEYERRMAQNKAPRVRSFMNRNDLFIDSFEL
jgi:serine/threonine protein kinase